MRFVVWREQIDAQRFENGLEHGQRDKAYDQNVERAHAFDARSTLSMTTWKNSGEMRAKN